MFRRSAQHVDSDQMVEYLSARPSPAWFALIKFSLGSHRLRVETDRWPPVIPSIGQGSRAACTLPVPDLTDVVSRMSKM